MIQAFLLRYWKELAALALLSFAVWRGYGWAHGNGVAEERALWLAKENQALVAAVAERDKALADAAAAQREIDRLANLPRKVVEVVRANPSGCSLAKPVADGLRDQVRKTNDAMRRNSRAAVR